jgi:hypothetical protein
MIRRGNGILSADSEGVALSAEIIRLRDRRRDAEASLEIDLPTAIDVAIRDLREIEAQWGTAQALERLAECRAMLLTVYETFSYPE